MNISQDLKIKDSGKSSLLDNVVAKVTKSLDRSLSREQTFTEIKRILERNDHLQKILFDKLVQQDALKYSLLLGFFFKFGFGTRKDEQRAFEQWKKDGTPTGKALVGYCYHYGCGVEQDFRKAFQYYKTLRFYLYIHLNFFYISLET